MWLVNAVIIGKLVHGEIVPLVPQTPTLMTEIRFDNGNAVTIRDGWVQASPPELTAIIDTLAATLPGYGKMPFILDEDFNIAEGLIRMVGVGKIVRRDKMPPLPADVPV
jgi:hypothetical protein